MNAVRKEQNLKFLNIIFPVFVWDRNLVVWLFGFFSPLSNDSQPYKSWKKVTLL